MGVGSYPSTEMQILLLQPTGPDMALKSINSNIRSLNYQNTFLLFFPSLKKKSSEYPGDSKHTGDKRTVFCPLNDRDLIISVIILQLFFMM